MGLQHGPQEADHATPLTTRPPGSLVSRGAHDVLDGHRAALQGRADATQFGEPRRAPDDGLEYGKLAGLRALGDRLLTLPGEKG
jgi:hypothetical protein